MTCTAKKEMMSLQLKVNNHPGVMSHVCGLFARRAFNLEGILVTPIGDGNICTVWLLMNRDERLEQMIKQVSKLQDVLEVEVKQINSEAFTRLGECMRGLQVAAG